MCYPITVGLLMFLISQAVLPLCSCDKLYYCHTKDSF